MNRNLGQIRQKKISAFSLVELSIVLLVIGIVSAGITQSSILVSKYRLNIAKKTTQSSPVSSISDLAFWFETTSEKSFSDPEIQDGDLVSSWQDISPRSYDNFSATSSLTSRPTYQANCINSLPCLSFDGVNDYLDLTSYKKGLGEFAFFIVARFNPGESGVWETMLQSHVETNVIDDGQIFIVFTSAGNIQAGLNYSGEALIVQGAHSFSEDKSTNFLIHFYEDNAASVSARINQDTKINVTSNLIDGGVKYIDGFSFGNSESKGSPYLGQISEIILFERNLKISERNDVENYLIQKWNLDI